MSRPMEFPSRSGRLLPILLAALLGPFLLALAAGGWLALTLSPLQDFYLGTYAASSVGEGIPDSQTAIRWAMKTAPRRKSVPLMPGDALRDTAAGADKKLPLKLSAQAIAEGWRGVALSAPDRGPSSILAPILRDTFYGGESFYRLMGAPMLGALAAALLLFGGFPLAREAWSSGAASRAERRRELRHGRRTKGPELALPGRAIGGAVERFRARRDDGVRLRLTGDGLLSKLPGLGPSYRVPRRLESSHILLMGDTGSGKSSAIRQILRQVEGRGETAVVYDPAMDFVGEFYSPKRGDLILNPLDARCPYWSLSDEVERGGRGGSAAAIAAAFLPDKEYEKAFFTDSPRRILACLLGKNPRPTDILKWMADPGRIEEMVRGTPLAALIDPAAPAQRAGVLSSLNLVADSLELLPEREEANGKKFSTAERLKESRSVGVLRDKKSFALEVAVKPLVMASEIAGLAPLSGFIKQENRVVPARFRLARKRARQPEFVPRKMPELKPRPQIEAIAPAPAPPLLAAAQGVLPPAPAAAARKPAFVWDESQGIE